MKKKQKDKMIYFDLFDQYQQLRNNEKFISFNKLISSVLLSANLGYKSNEYNNFISNFEQAKANRWFIKFQKFVIGFEQNDRFGSLVLIPLLVSEDDSSVQTYSLLPANDNIFLTTLNQTINNLLQEGYKIEIASGLILFNLQETNQLKLFFDKEWISYLKEQDGTR